MPLLISAPTSYIADFAYPLFFSSGDMSLMNFVSAQYVRRSIIAVSYNIILHRQMGVIQGAGKREN